MKTVRVYQVIAVINGGIGALLAVGVVAAGIAAAFAEGKKSVLAFGLLAVLAIVAVSLIHSAVVHLKRPSRPSALTLAANSAVIIWILCSRFLNATDLKDIVGPAYVGIAILLAYLCYRLVLKPAALRAFPSNEKTA